MPNTTHVHSPHRSHAHDQDDPWAKQPVVFNFHASTVLPTVVPHPDTGQVGQDAVPQLVTTLQCLGTPGMQWWGTPSSNLGTGPVPNGRLRQLNEPFQPVEPPKVGVAFIRLKVSFFGVVGWPLLCERGPLWPRPGLRDWTRKSHVRAPTCTNLMNLCPAKFQM